MTRLFKRKDAAERFRDAKKRKGFFASVFEEPVDPQASTRRARARKRYIVQYDTGKALMSNPPSGWIPASSVKVVRHRNGAVEVHVRRPLSRKKRSKRR